MPTTQEARSRLAALMEERRTQLRMRWQDVAEAGRVSLKAIHAARTGTAAIRPLTQRGIEDGLRWAPGSVEDILAGGEPRDADDSRRPGQELIERRASLLPRYRSRAEFARDNGLNEEFIRAVEVEGRAPRDNDELRDLAAAYRVSEQSLAEYLAGAGPLVPASAAPLDIVRPAGGESVTIADAVSVLLSPDEQAVWDDVHAHGGTLEDPDEADLWALSSFPEAERVRMIAAVRQARRESAVRTARPPARPRAV